MAKVRDLLRRNLIVASVLALFVVGLVVSSVVTGGFKASLASTTGYGYGVSPTTTPTTSPTTITKVYVTPPPASQPGTVSVRVTTNQPNALIHLFDEYSGATNYVQKAVHVAEPGANGNGVWTFEIPNVQATNSFYAVVNGVKSNTVAAVISSSAVSQTKVYVTPPPASQPGTVSVRVTTNQPNALIHLFDEYSGATNYVQKAVHVAEPGANGNGVWTFEIPNVQATNSFYAVVNGVKSNTVTAPIK